MNKSILIITALLTFPVFATDPVAEMTDAQEERLTVKCLEGGGRPMAPAVITRCGVVNHENRLDAIDSGNYESRISAVEVDDHAQDDRITVLEDAPSWGGKGLEVLFPDKILIAYNGYTKEYLGPVYNPYPDSNAHIIKMTINGEDAYILNATAVLGFYHMDDACLDFSHGTNSDLSGAYSARRFEHADFMVKHHGDSLGDHFIYKLDRSIDPIVTDVAYQITGGVCRAVRIDSFAIPGYYYEFYPISYDALFVTPYVIYKYVDELPK